MKHSREPNVQSALEFEQWKSNEDIIAKIGYCLATLGFQHLFYFPQVNKLWHKVYLVLGSELDYFNFQDTQHLSDNRIFSLIATSNNVSTLLATKLSFYENDGDLSSANWKTISLSKFNGLMRLEFINCDIKDTILSSILLQTKCLEELKVRGCELLTSGWIRTITQENARARTTLKKLDFVLILAMHDLADIHLLCEWENLVDLTFPWRYDLIQCPFKEEKCLSLSCILGKLIHLKNVSIRFDSYTNLGVAFKTDLFKRDISLLKMCKNLNLTSLTIEDRASVIYDEDLAQFAEAFPNVTTLRLKNSLVASLPESWCPNLNDLYWTTKAKCNAKPFSQLPCVKHLSLDRAFSHHISRGEYDYQLVNQALVETMKASQLETLCLTYFEQFPAIPNTFSKQLEHLSSIDFSHSNISNPQLSMILSIVKNIIKSLVLFHCEDISEKGLSPLFEENNKNSKKNNQLTFLNLGSTSIQTEAIKKIVERAPLLETFKLTSYFKGVKEKKDTQKNFNELCLVLSTCQYLHTIYLSENDYVNDNNLISIFTGQPNIKSKVNPTSIVPRSTTSPISKIYLFNIDQSVTDKFLKFLSTDERTLMLRYLDLAQTWKPTTKHIPTLLNHCHLLSVQMSRQSIGKKMVALPEEQRHRLIISYQDLHQF